MSNFSNSMPILLRSRFHLKSKMHFQLLKRINKRIYSLQGSRNIPILKTFSLKGHKHSNHYHNAWNCRLLNMRIQEILILLFIWQKTFSLLTENIFQSIQPKNSNLTHEFHSFSFQAKDLHLSLILICVICVFFICNFPRLLLNLYEMFHCDAIIACGDRFFPPVWFICSNAVNHLLLVVNCIMNFVVYCYFNRSFR